MNVTGASRDALDIQCDENGTAQVPVHTAVTRGVSWSDVIEFLREQQ